MFIGGNKGTWQIVDVRSVFGANLDFVDRVNVVNENITELPVDSSRILQGFSSNVRYAMHDEVTALKAIQPVLNRSEAICAVLIPIKKSLQWWEMAQDERRAIFEGVSSHRSEEGLSAWSRPSAAALSRY